MSDQPSIKGSAFQGAVDDLMALLESGRLDRDCLEVSLEPADLACLDEKVSAASWYPIGTYVRIVELLAAVEGSSDRERYLIQRGARAAERLTATGLYQQLEATRDTWGDRVGNIMVSMARAIYNFTSWSFEFDRETRGFTIKIEDAADFPEIARLTAQGFVQAVADRTALDPTEVSSERTAPDRVLIRGRATRR
jgi:hypothetical protein